jgi:surface protein
MKKLKPKNYLPQLLKLLLAFFMCLPMWASSLRAQDQPYAEYDSDSETLTFRYGAKPAGAYDLNEGNATPRWWDDLINSEDPEQHNKINKVVFDASFANARPTSCFMWFDGCSDLTEIEGIENLNTEEVTNMGYMFYGCSSLTSLNVSNFDTQNVTDMSYMFSTCSGLKSLNVSHFDTQNVKNMSNMFYSCRSLTSLDVSKFNTQKVENMHAMFSWCKGLHSLNLSKFDTQNVKDMSRMFRRSSALKTIYVSDKFVTTKVSNGSEMFKDCTSLKGAIDYDASKIDPAYANYETGYFTKLVGKNGNDKIGAVGEVLTAESLALADDKDFEAYEPFTAKTATYTRTLKEGTSWATLCLPFNVELEGQNFRAFNLLSATDDIIKLQEVETSIEAGKPVVIKMNEGENTLSFTYSGATIAPEAQTVQASENSGYKLTGIYTQKVFDKTADNNCFIIKGGSLMNPAMVLSKTSTQTVGTKPFRAYMQENGTEGGARAFSLSFEGEATAIKTLNGVDADNAEYYDLQGRRINSLQKGINIIKHGGKATKILIR